MSLAVVFKGPEGIVLAADSRVTLMAGQPTPAGVQMLPVFFDNATKLLSLDPEKYKHLGLVTYGAGTIGLDEPRTAHSFLPELEQHLDKQRRAQAKGQKKSVRQHRLTVRQAAHEIGRFFNQQWRKAKMPPNAESLVFLVAGFDGAAPYGRVYEVSVPDATVPVELNADGFGISWGGITFYAERLLSGVAPRAIDVAVDELGLTDDQAKALEDRWREGASSPDPISVATATGLRRSGYVSSGDDL